MLQGLMPYLLLVLLPTIVIAGLAAWRVRSTYSKWDKVDSGIRMSPFDFARYLLDRQGLQQVRVEPTPGHLTDHYDPRGKILRVSSAVAGSRDRGYFDPLEQTLGIPDQRSGSLSVAAAAVIAHEVGHAQQDAQRDPAMALRQLIVPVAQLGSGLAPWLVIIGLIMNLTGLAVVGLVFFAGAVLFTFVTLPVEFGASNRALAFVAPLGIIGERERGARAVLRAAGWTYVAAALTALLTFLYYLMLIMGSRR
ncbi:MAG TPA: zinc metallopeptidase [Candidatus Caenarcaniphilales bacterium]|nr:zinc metallopeptidase [Candidatus Caenarcaniphilales bacterium]